MRNLSMFYKLFNVSERIALKITCLVWTGTLIGFWVVAHNWLISLIMTLASMLSASLYYHVYSKNRILLDQITTITEEWRKGSAEKRIIKIGGRTTKVQQIAWALNDLMDQVETAQVDMHYSMAYLTYGDFSRRSYPDGLHGGFASALKRLNSITKILSSTTNAINTLVHAIYEGDFSKTVEANVEGEYQIVIEKALQAMQAMKNLSGDVGYVMDCVAQGNINHRVHADARGDFGRLKNNINATLDALGSLDDIAHVATALSTGDLTQTAIDKNYAGVFGELVKSMNNTINNLQQMMSEISHATDTISYAARGIAHGNSELAGRTNTGLESLEKTAANMEELTHTVQQNTQNARLASELARNSSGIAKTGVNVVNQVIKTMEAINESSRKIVDIISVIDGIAFQTNILALNASVEAARAGDQGRGFAVVASEVRSLAQRSANAAGEIKSLINDSVEKVEDGTLLVAKAGKTMEDIVNSIEGVTQMISEISAASEEQNAGIGAINNAINEMDDTTQQNATLVENASASSQSLEKEVKNLSSMVANFKLSGEF